MHRNIGMGKDGKDPINIATSYSIQISSIENITDCVKVALSPDSEFNNTSVQNTDNFNRYHKFKDF